MKDLPKLKINKTTHFPNKNLGFSLVEMLMVLAIIVVLAAIIIALINPLGRINYAKTQSAKAQMKTFQMKSKVHRFSTKRHSWA